MPGPFTGSAWHSPGKRPKGTESEPNRGIKLRTRQEFCNIIFHFAPQRHICSVLNQLNPAQKALLLFILPFTFLLLFPSYRVKGADLITIYLTVLTVSVIYKKRWTSFRSASNKVDELVAKTLVCFYCGRYCKWMLRRSGTTECLCSLRADRSRKHVSFVSYVKIPTWCHGRANDDFMCLFFKV